MMMKKLRKNLMIGKQTKGKSFRGLLNYLEQNSKAEIIAGNMGGRNAIQLSKEFRLSRQLHPEAEKVVYHASLSLPPGERLDDYTWDEITSKYLEGMGFGCNQYVVYRHSDKDHDHVHIVASRIRLDDAKIVSDSWDYVRSENLIRQLEKEYGLQQAPSSRETYERSLSAGQSRRMEREQAEYESGQRNSPPERTVKEQLQTTINEAIKSSSSMPELMKKLLLENVSVRCEFTRTGKPKGISYGMNGIAFSGTKLGKAYTFPGLQKYESIKYNPKTDKVLIINMMQYTRTAKKIEASELDKIVPNNIIQQNTQQQLNQREVARFALILKEAWEYIGRPKFRETKNYCFENHEGRLKFTRKSGEVVIDLPLDGSHSPVSNIKEEDKETFEKMLKGLRISQRKQAERFASILKETWDCLGQPNFIETDIYGFERVENQLKITRPNGELVADLSLDDSQEPVFNIEEEDKENFEGLSEIVKEVEREKAEEEEQQLKRSRGFSR